MSVSIETAVFAPYAHAPISAPHPYPTLIMNGSALVSKIAVMPSHLPESLWMTPRSRRYNESWRLSVSMIRSGSLIR